MKKFVFQQERLHLKNPECKKLYLLEPKDKFSTSLKIATDFKQPTSNQRGSFFFNLYKKTIPSPELKHEIINWFGENSSALVASKSRFFFDQLLKEPSQSSSKSSSKAGNKKNILLSLSLLSLFGLQKDQNKDENTISSHKLSLPSIPFSTIGYVFAWVAGIIGTSLLIALLLAYRSQRKLIYFPMKKLLGNPADYKLPYEDIVLTTRDGVKLHSWFIRHKQNSMAFPTVLYLHGNGGNISTRLENADTLLQMHCNILLLDYRGYGRSQGNPSEHGLISDAQAALDFLHSRPDIDHNKIFVFGASIGGAVAIALVKENQHRVRSLIVENTFTSLIDMMKIVYPITRHFSFMLNDTWKSLERIQSSKIPTLFISGQSDTLIPPSMMETLFNHCPSKHKEIAKITNGEHNDTWKQQDYMHHLKSFIDKVLDEEARADS